MIGSQMPRVAFFHQNEPYGIQGGVERYLSTVLKGNPGNSILVTEAGSVQRPQRITIRIPTNSGLPKGMRYLFGLFKERDRVKKALSTNNITALEFSRPELALFACLLDGRKTFTIHGLGPPKKEFLTYLIYYLSCFALPYMADLVQVFGRDTGGVPSFVVKQLGNRIKYIDAWYDDVFTLADMPPIEDMIKISIGGRLAPQKNPSLLFDIIRAIKQDRTCNVEFRYHGSDGHVIKAAGLENVIHCRGLLTLEELAREISVCHAGILCSAYGEGSPFTIVESLACGRPFIAPPLRTLKAVYADTPGVIFAADWTVGSYLAAIRDLQKRLLSGLTAQSVRAGAHIETRSEKIMSNIIFGQIAGSSS
jgi:glycosyltransferase involved in cell wall biosynthesis